MNENTAHYLRLTTYGLLFAVYGLLLSYCAQPALDARESTTAHVSRAFDSDANQAYYAVRWALKTSGYSIISEDLQNGILTSGWRPSTVDSHYVDPFGHRDYGVNGAYFRLEVKIVPEEGSANRTTVEISSRVKSMLAHMKSSKIEEKKILGKVADYLRKADIHVTNVGVEE